MLRAIKAGDDPFAKKPGEVPTFAEAAKQVVEERRASWTNPREAGNWINSFWDYVLPRLGNRLVSDIQPFDVLDVLLPIWDTKRGTARKVRSRIGAVLNWAAIRAW